MTHTPESLKEDLVTRLRGTIEWQPETYLGKLRMEAASAIEDLLSALRQMLAVPPHSTEQERAIEAANEAITKATRRA